MASGKRRATESLKTYRYRLSSEEYSAKRKLAGRVVWPGSFGTARRIGTVKGRFYTNGTKSVKIN